MATKVISLSDKSLTSSYNAYNDAFGNTSLDTPSIAYYGISGIPQLILIGKDGNVISINARGNVLVEELKKQFDQAG